jgi:hypothetical protein
MKHHLSIKKVVCEVIAIVSENRKKRISTGSEQNAELLINKTGSTYSYHWV